MKRIVLATCTTVALLVSCSNEKRVHDSTASGIRADTDSLIKEKEVVETAADTTAAGIEFPSPNEFHKMLARSNGTWIGEGTMQFSPDAPPVNAGTSMLINKMAMDGLYQVSEIKGIPAPGMGEPWTGLRITGYDRIRKVFTRAMIGDGTAAGGVAMEGAWDEITKSITMPFKKTDRSTGEERDLKEVYKIIDENTEVLEIHGTDPKTGKQFKMLNIKWTRKM